MVRGTQSRPGSPFFTIGSKTHLIGNRRRKNNTLNTPNLFTPVRLGALEAPNRIVLAPLTGMRAGPGGVPTPLMAEYYAQRAMAGLIITEPRQFPGKAQATPTRPASTPMNRSPAGSGSPRRCIVPAAAFFFSSRTWAGSLIRASNRTAVCRLRPAPSFRDPARRSRRTECNRTLRRAP